MTTSTPTLSTTDSSTVRRARTGTRATRLLGGLTVAMMGWLVAFGLGFSPADRNQKEAVRIMYVHVPTVWLAYLAFTVTAACSGLYLFSKKHSLGFDRFAGKRTDDFLSFTFTRQDLSKYRRGNVHGLNIF